MVLYYPEAYLGRTLSYIGDEAFLQKSQQLIAISQIIPIIDV